MTPFLAPAALGAPIRSPRPGQPAASGPAAAVTDPYADWCRRIRDGHADAFEALFRDLHPALLRFADGYAESAAAADDLVQEAFARLWEKRARLDPARSVRALLYQTVRNLALNRSRDRASRQDKLAGLAADPAPAPALPDAQAGAGLLARHLHAWVDALPDRQAEALRLTRFEGLDHAEAATVMGLSPRTVNNHLVRALRTLRARTLALDPTLLRR